MEQYDIKEYSENYFVGYAKDNGYEILKLLEGSATIKMKILSRHMNPLNTVHGGVVFALADTTGGIAARTMEAYPTTCSSTISYLRPTMDSEELIAKADVMKRGKNTVVVEISISDNRNIHVAHVVATYFDLNK